MRKFQWGKGSNDSLKKMRSSINFVCNKAEFNCGNLNIQYLKIKKVKMEKTTKKEGVL